MMIRKSIVRPVALSLSLMAAPSAFAQSEAAAPAKPGDSSTGADAGTSPPLSTIPVTTLPEPSQTPAAEKKVDTSPVQLDSVVVTAGKRKQELNKVAGSVNAIGGKELEKIKAQTLSDYIKLVPGVVINDQGGDSGGVTIRGIATAPPVAGIGTQFTQLPVGTYIDDLPLSDLFVPLSVPDLNPFDLERVEILKGPQSTIFGSGALSGAVRYILQKPKLNLYEGKLSASLNSTPYSNGLSPVYAGAANAPIGRNAAIRVAGVTRKYSGAIDDAANGRDIDKVKQNTARVLGTWNVTEQFKLNAFAFTQDTELMSGPFADNPRTLSRDDGGMSMRKSGFTGGNFSLGYDFEPVGLISSTSYDTKTSTAFGDQPAGFANPQGDPDGDGGENGTGSEDVGMSDFEGTFLDSKTRNFFQEFRAFSPDGADWKPTSWLGVKYLAGLAYQKSNQRAINDATYQSVTAIGGTVFTLPVAVPDNPLMTENTLSNSYIFYDTVATEKAVYGEFTAKLFEKLELTLGARYFETNLKVNGFLEGTLVLALTGMPRVDVNETTAENGVTPKAALRYSFTENLQVFALAAKGFQFGGIQIQLPSPVFQQSVPDAFNPYKSSKLWNYEAGLRTEFFQRKLAFNLTGFYLDWKDLQITIPRAIAPETFPGGPNIRPAFVQNIGSARSIGAETSLTIKPAKGLSLTSSAAWTSAVTTEDFDSTAGLVVSGTRLPGSPQFQMSNLLAYTVPSKLFSWAQADLRLTHIHTGGSFNDLQYSRRQGDFDTLDLGLSLKKKNWFGAPDVSLNMINLTDTRGVSSVVGNANFRDINYYFTRPRTLIASLALGF